MALRIPICARPLAPPPLSVSPILGLFPVAESCAADGRMKVKMIQPEINRVRTREIGKFENLKILKLILIEFCL